MHQLDDLGPAPVPFGYCNADWKRLLARMQPGDELREFCSSEQRWEHLAGRAGVVLLRSGQQVTCVITSMN